MKVCFVYNRTRLYWVDLRVSGVNARPIPEVGDWFVWKDKAYSVERRVFDYPEDEIRLGLRLEGKVNV